MKNKLLYIVLLVHVCVHAMEPVRVEPLPGVHGFELGGVHLTDGGVLHEPGTVTESGPHFVEEPDIPGVVPHEVREPDEEHHLPTLFDDYLNAGQDDEVLHHNIDRDDSLFDDPEFTVDPVTTISGQALTGVPDVVTEEPFTPSLNQELIDPVNASQGSIDSALKAQESTNKVLKDFVDSVQRQITALEQKPFTVFADYVDPLARLEYSKHELEKKVEDWDSLWSDVDSITADQANAMGDVFDAMVEQLSRIEDILGQTQAIMKEKSVKDLNSLYTELRAIENDVNSARGSSFWGKNGSLRKAAERIERLRFILEGASQASPDGLPASNPDSYQHTVNSLKELLRTTELKLQEKQMAELKKNNLIKRAKDSYANLAKLTVVKDSTTSSGKKIIKDAKKVVKELDTIITTDLDYRDHILQEHENRAFEMLVDELIHRGIITDASALTEELMQSTAVRDISTQLFEGQDKPQEWQDSIDYVLIHRLKVKIEENVQKQETGLKVLKKQYGSGAIKNMRNSASSVDTLPPEPLPIDPLSK